MRNVFKVSVFVFFVVVGFSVMMLICEGTNTDPLPADIEFKSDGIRIMNTGGPTWQDVKIEVNDIYKARVAAKIDSGKANFVPYRDLATDAGMRFLPQQKVNEVTITAMAPKFRVKSFIVE